MDGDEILDIPSPEEILPTEDDLLATVGDVKAAAENVAGEVINEINQVAHEVTNAEDEKWLNLTNQIQNQSVQLAAMTEVLTATQLAVVSSLQTLTELLTPKPEQVPEPKTETPDTTHSQESKAEPVANQLAGAVDNPATTVIESVEKIAHKEVKPHKKWI